jgi:hypothetical protein
LFTLFRQLAFGLNGKTAHFFFNTVAPFEEPAGRQAEGAGGNTVALDYKNRIMFQFAFK